MALNRGYCYRHQVQPQQVKHQTVLGLLTAVYRHSGAAEWAQRLGRGEVALEEQTLSTDAPIRAGQWVQWQRPPWDEPTVPLHYEVAHQDADLLIVNKPSGLPTMPAGGFLEHTLLHQVRLHWPSAQPLHRLGRGTSGLVAFGLQPWATSQLAQQWRQGEVQKVYLALATGQVWPTEFGICTPIGQVPHERLGRVWAAHPQGKPSRSLVQVRWRAQGQATGQNEDKQGEDSSLCEINILTGRPHQIRIHLASVGHPLLGDPLYGPFGLPLAALAALPSDLGYCLEAHQLALRHPRTGQQLQVSTKPPQWASPQT